MQRRPNVMLMSRSSIEGDLRLGALPLVEAALFVPAEPSHASVASETVFWPSSVEK